MREIRWPLDGPHDPETVYAAGEVLAGAVRYLNRATRTGQGGLVSPADVYSLLASLYAATGGMQQLAGQVAAFLRAQAATGRLRDPGTEDPDHWARMVAADLEETGLYFAEITHQLQRRQADLSGMSAAGGSDER